MLDRRALGRRIGSERRARAMTQEQLAERLDISTEHLSRIETGAFRPSLGLIEKISTVLEMDEAEIMFGTLSDLTESRALMEKIVSMDQRKRQAAERIIDAIAEL